MGTFDALDKAKKAAERASQTAKEAKDQAAVKAAEIRDLTVSKAHEASVLAAEVRDQAAAKVDNWKDAVVDKLIGVKDAALDGVKQLTEDLNAYLPAISEAGYTLKDVSVEVGIIPVIQATFTARPDITEERIQDVMVKHADGKVLPVILRALYGAYKLQNTINIAGMKPHGIMLSLGVAPFVAVKFHPVEPSNALPAASSA